MYTAQVPNTVLIFVKPKRQAYQLLKTLTIFTGPEKISMSLTMRLI